MTQNTKIEWADHTFNPWWGCVRVSEGCQNCYAEAFDKRVGGTHWGPTADRRVMSDAYWREPLKWSKAALAAGTPARVFCGSMCDVMEGSTDPNSVIATQHQRLWALIRDTPGLVWLLLTKRPQNIKQLLPTDLKGHPRIWLGMTAENQARFDERWRHLVDSGAVVRFISYEPALGPLDLKHTFGLYEPEDGVFHLKVGARWDASPDWVIAGGESGRGARPAHPDWFRLLCDQCAAAEVPFLFKQWGEYGPYDAIAELTGRYEGLKQAQQGAVVRLGKKAAGRLLDGREWNDIPVIQ